jgi:hypothetical protein
MFQARKFAIRKSETDSPGKATDKLAAYGFASRTEFMSWRLALL